jgi:small subunit ribosomal protein S16
MPVRIRLKRIGGKGKPCSRIVVCNSRSPRDGRFIEEIGSYDPSQNPAFIKLNTERVQYWLKVGAKPSETVRSVFKKKGIRL